jgi:hypothetical protein
MVIHSYRDLFLYRRESQAVIGGIAFLFVCWQFPERHNAVVMAELDTVSVAFGVSLTAGESHCRRRNCIHIA